MHTYACCTSMVCMKSGMLSIMHSSVGPWVRNTSLAFRVRLGRLNDKEPRFLNNRAITVPDHKLAAKAHDPAIHLASCITFVSHVNWANYDCHRSLESAEHAIRTHGATAPSDSKTVYLWSLIEKSATGLSSKQTHRLFIRMSFHQTPCSVMADSLPFIPSFRR